MLNFHRGDLRLLSYLPTKADAPQCQIRTLSIRATEARINYTLVGFLSAHLKPQVYEIWTEGELPEDYAMLFVHGVLFGNLRHLVFKVSTLSLEVHLHFFGVTGTQGLYRNYAVLMKPFPCKPFTVLAFNTAVNYWLTNPSPWYANIIYRPSPLNAASAF